MSDSSNNNNNNKGPLKENLKSAVQGVNLTLEKAQEQFESWQQPVSDMYQRVSDAASIGAAHTLDAWERRKEFGLLEIGALSVTAGAITTVRRGRLPGIASAVVVGGLAYGAIYGLDLPE